MKRLVVMGLVLAAVALAEDSPFLPEQEKVEIQQPLLRVTRPSKDWVFLDLAVLKKNELAKAGSAKGRVEDAFEKLKVEMQLSSASASFFVHAWTERRDVDAAKLGAETLEQTRGYFEKQGKVLGNGKAKLGKLDAWGLEVEGKLTSNGEEMNVSKLVVFRPDDKTAFVLSLEVPKKNADRVKKDRKKLFSSDVVKVQ